MSNSSTNGITTWHVIGKFLVVMAIATLAACGGGGGGGSSGGIDTTAAPDNGATSPADRTGSGPDSNAGDTGGTGGAAPPPPSVEPPAPGPSGPGLVAQEPSRVNTTTAGDQKAQAIGALTDGGYTVAWVSQSAAGTSTLAYFYIQRYDAAGAKVGGETLIPFEFGTANIPAIAVRSDGGVVLAYTSARALTPSQPFLVTYGVHTRRFDAGGTPIEGEALVTSRTFNVAGDQGIHFFTNARVISWEDGSYAVGWAYVEGNYTGVVPIFATQRYDRDGQRDTSPQLSIGSGGGDVLTEFQMIAIPDGRFVFATAVRNMGRALTRFSVGGGSMGFNYDALDGLDWMSWTLLPLSDGFVLWSTDSSGSYVQLLDRTGNALGPRTPVESRPGAAAALRDGGYVTVNQLGTAQRFDGTGAAVGEPFQAHPWAMAASLRNGGLAAAWTTTSPGGDQDVFGQRFAQPD